MAKEVSVFMYKDYRKFLRTFFAAMKKEGKSIRFFTQKCQISSPSYFREHIEKQHKMTSETAKKVAKGLDMSDLEVRYFCLLTEYDRESDQTERKRIEAELERLKKMSQAERKVDKSLNSHWLIPVIRQLSLLPDFVLSVPNIYERVKRIASNRDVEEAVAFLIRKRYLIPGETLDTFIRSNIEFKIINDVRDVNVQDVHRRFLDIAKHRLIDDVQKREYQGLTIAMRLDQMEELKKRIREFVREVDADYSHVEDANTVLRLQFCAFRVVD